MTARDDLRIGDAEREAVMTALREHYAQGRLTHEELDERLELALSSRTGRELALVGADLPDLYGSHPEDPEDAEDFRGRGDPAGPGGTVRDGAPDLTGTDLTGTIITGTTRGGAPLIPRPGVIATRPAGVGRRSFPS
ncbi:DUF1707 domain-containing protein [Streptosporangium lutulentum]